jgi:hypothetical protein
MVRANGRDYVFPCEQGCEGLIHALEKHELALRIPVVAQVVCRLDVQYDQIVGHQRFLSGHGFADKIGICIACEAGLRDAGGAEQVGEPEQGRFARHYG